GGFQLRRDGPCGGRGARLDRNAARPCIAPIHAGLHGGRGITMKHVSEGELQAYLDDALPAGDRAEVRGHLASCAACRGAYGVLRESAETFSRAVALLDGPVPATTAADVRERAESGAYVSYSAGGARRAWLRAAIVVL